MKKHKIFIACDTKNPNEIKNIINKSKTNKLNVGYKIGLEFFLPNNVKLWRLDREVLFHF